MILRRSLLAAAPALLMEPVLAGLLHRVERDWAVAVTTYFKQRGLTRGNPVDDTFADHDYRCVGAT